MKNSLMAVLIFVLLSVLSVAQAKKQTSTRLPQFSNQQVTVWKTIVYPSSTQAMTMHRHDHNRVVVALTEGTLKITNDKGAVHYMKFEKDKAYYLTKDIPNERHNDENLTNHPMKFMVVELADN